MFYKAEKDAQGEYVGPDGEHYVMLVVRRVRGPVGVNVGYVPFPSLESAMEHWGLVPSPEQRCSSS